MNPSDAPPRAFARLLTVSALLELATGVALLAIPRAALSLLFGRPPSDDAVLAARCYAVAVAALGFSWWLARESPRRCRESVPGYLAFNLGLGALFGSSAMTSGENALLLGMIAAGHIALGLAGLATSRTAPARSEQAHGP